jgi:hypothetical protein
MHVAQPWPRHMHSKPRRQSFELLTGFWCAYFWTSLKVIQTLPTHNILPGQVEKYPQILLESLYNLSYTLGFTNSVIVSGDPTETRVRMVASHH